MITAKEQNPTATLNEPLFPEPLLFEKIWGGNKINQVLQKKQKISSSIGESWELSDVPGQPSQVQINQKPAHLDWVFKNYRQAILGAQASSNWERFPLLYKFIDASDKLSVQVHPGPGSSLGDSKTEAWHVIEAPEGAKIIVGIESNLSEPEIFELLKSPDAPKILKHIPVKAGDTLYIPPGTVHAITEGLLIYEIQQNSDTTFRLYDWGRTDDQGKPRQLHLNEAREVTCFKSGGNFKTTPLVEKCDGYTRATLAACEFFILEKWHLQVSELKLDAPKTFQVLTNLGETFTLMQGSKTWLVPKGQTVLIPASLGQVTIISPHSQALFLRSFIPDTFPQPVSQRLVEAGFSKKEVESLYHVYPK